MRNKNFFSVKLIIIAAALFPLSAAGQTEPPSAPAYYTDKSINIDMVFVYGGTFTMGCAAGRGGDCLGNEKPARNVTLGNFYIGRCEVTQKQWTALMGSNPSLQQGDDLPVENVSWDSVKVFIEKLNAVTETGKQYRLPTEAEWEYAARGGAAGAGYTYSGGGDIDSAAWYEGNSGGKTNPVGGKAPNELGIYDMSGNVWEMVGDWYGDYGKEPQTDPSGPQWGTNRVIRGGGWSSGARDCRVSRRVSLSQSFGDVGFRLAIGPRKTIQAPQLSQLALIEPTHVKKRDDTIPAPVRPLELSGKGERPRGYVHKWEKGLSVGIGGFYGGGYGGGLSWANGEEVSMPYTIGGAYLFADAVYAEAFAGYSSGGGKWKSQDARNADDLPEMPRSCINMGVLLKYPLNMAAGAGNVFPLAGFDYEASVSGKLKYANGRVYEFGEKNWRHGATALSALWLKLGFGFDIHIIRNAGLRAEFLYGIRTANALEKNDAASSGRSETRPGYGVTCRVGAGIKLL